MTMISPPPLELENEEMLVPHQEFKEGSQPMEVYPAETVSTPANAQVEDPPALKYWLTIENFSRLNNKKLYSDIFHVGRYQWRALIFPKGNNVDHLALQSLLYKFLYNDNTVATKELTKSFGWDSFVPHDVEELNRVLCEKLEDKMKGTVVEGTNQHLFEGHHMNYIECIKYTRKESFYDLQLDVKGSWDVYASFDKYVKVEWLEGDNKYQVENLGLQLEDGDIICYQKSLTSANINQFPYPNLPSFLEYIHNCQNMDAYLVAVSTRDCKGHGFAYASRVRFAYAYASCVRFAYAYASCVRFAYVSGVPHRGNLQSDELANNQLFAENEPSVVFIENRVPPGAIGSGFIWDTIGHIVTNYHVIDGADVLSVTLADETGYKAKVVGCDRDNDVAVLRIKAPEQTLKPIKVGISSNLLMGQKVFAIGHPFGLRHTFADGIISGLRRTFLSPANGSPIQDAIQTTAAINPGNSGGPLLDRSGYLIGINTAICSPSRVFCGIAFAVPVDTVKGIVDQIVNFGEVRRPISGDSGSLRGDQVSVVLEPNPDAP